jgi:hypothetical protein
MACAALLVTQEDFVVVAEAADGKEAVSLTGGGHFKGILSFVSPSRVRISCRLS